MSAGGDLSILRPAWSAPVTAGFTTRHGGVSQPPYDSLNLAMHVGDDPAAVRENRRRLVAHAGLAEEPRWLSQVHGTRVVHASEVERDVTAADAVWSDQPGQVCAVLVADCVPILLAARDGSCVAAVHAGWRGLAAAVIQAAVETLPVPAASLTASVGPCIGADAYQVGPDVIQDIADAGVEPVYQPSAPAGTTASATASVAEPAADLASGASPRFQLDLVATARASLRRAGVGRAHNDACCTRSDSARFFSYRRDGTTGRFAAYVALNG